MTEDEIAAQQLFERVRSVEWDEDEAASNRHKHGIDFDDALEVFYGASLVRRSDRNMEERWVAIGESRGRVIAVVFTWRGEVLRIISARRARRHEERAYHQKKMGRSAEGQN